METRNDISNLLAMYIRNISDIYNITLCDQKSKQGHTTTSGMPCQLQHNENYNQRGRQTIVQV